MASDGSVFFFFLLIEKVSHSEQGCFPIIKKQREREREKKRKKLYFYSIVSVVSHRAMAVCN